MGNSPEQSLVSSVMKLGFKNQNLRKKAIGDTEAKRLDTDSSCNFVFDLSMVSRVALESLLTLTVCF